MVKKSKKQNKPLKNKKIERVAILSNFTLKGLPASLSEAAKSYGINLEIFEGSYGQWQQHILNDDLVKFEPDIVFIFVDLFGFDAGIWNTYHVDGDSNISQKRDSLLASYFHSLDMLKSKISAKIVCANFSESVRPLMGIMDNKMSLGQSRLVSEANQTFENKYRADKQVFIFDFRSWLSRVGTGHGWHDKFFFMADMRIAPGLFNSLANELVAYLVPLAGKTKKCLVLDLDNTIWGGIVGEDGLSGLHLAPTGPGQEFYLFQKLLVALSERGIVLAINSRNNQKDVAEVFAKHPWMILKREHFAAERINWQDKAQNIRELAKELNLGIDSLVFVDDDPVNRALVKEQLPEVAVIEMPADPAGYVNALLEYRGFNSFEFTDEDRKRSKMYVTDKERRIFEDQAVNLESFLRGLQLTVSIAEVDDFLIPRSAQLCQKTNQFNLTVRRHREEDIRTHIKSGSKVWALSAKDRFGEYGTVGLLIAANRTNHWEIDTFLLSCRVLGKRIEEQFFNFVLNELKKMSAKKIVGLYRPTDRNEQVKDFYKKHQFKRNGQHDGFEIWTRDLDGFKFKPIDFIDIMRATDKKI